MEEDFEMVCQGCGVTFVGSAAQARMLGQEGEAEKKPVFCSLCRAARGQSLREEQERTQYTGDPNEYRSPMACDSPPSRPRGPWRGPPREGGRAPSRGGGRRMTGGGQLFSATCTQCGATAHVPFQPSKFQQVLCRSCFQEKRNAPRGAGRTPER